MTTRRYYANAAPQRTLSGSLTSSATSLSVSGTFAGWPTQFPFYATLDIGTASAEIVLVTAVASSTATIVRGQDGTAAIAHAAGATFDQTVVRQDLDEASAHTSSSAGVHGVSGSVVGTSDAQTLTNKTMASPTITGTSAGTNATLSGTLTVAGAATLNGAASATAAGTGLAVTNNATVGGNLTVTGTSAGIIVPKSFTNEAAAGTQAAGTIVYLSAPTGAGLAVGLFVSLGSGTWQPVSALPQPNSSQTLLFTPGGNTDTPLSGTATWVTLGNVTVPAWATKCAVNYTCNGIFDTGTTSNVTLVIKIGSAAGAVSKRVVGLPGVANQRIILTVNDVVSSIASGTQSATISGTFVGGTVIRADTNSFFTAQFNFMP